MSGMCLYGADWTRCDSRLFFVKRADCRTRKNGIVSNETMIDREDIPKRL